MIYGCRLVWYERLSIHLQIRVVQTKLLILKTVKLLLILNGSLVLVMLVLLEKVRFRVIEVLLCLEVLLLTADMAYWLCTRIWKAILIRVVSLGGSIIVAEKVLLYILLLLL